MIDKLQKEVKKNIIENLMVFEREKKINRCSFRRNYIVCAKKKSTEKKLQ